MQRRWSDAERYIIYAVSRDPDSVTYRDSLLEVYAALERRSAAGRLARSILTANPSHGMANFVLGSIYMDAKQYDLAEVFFQRARKENEGSLAILNNLAWIRCIKGDLVEAEKLARAALAVDLSNADVWDTLGRVLAKKGVADEALKAFQEAYKLSDGKAEIALHYAQLLVEQGQPGKAAEVIDDIESDVDELSDEDHKMLKKLRKSLKK